MYLDRLFVLQMPIDSHFDACDGLETLDFLSLDNSLGVFRKVIVHKELDFSDGHLCLKLNRDTFLIKPAIYSGVNSLKDVSKSKLDE